MRRPRIVYIVTHAQSAGLVTGQMHAMRQAGLHIGFVSASGPRHDQVASQGFDTFAIPMAREIDVVGDVKALLGLIRLMHRWRPDIVNAGTPKAGLLGMIAAWLVGVPARVYVLRGLRMETISGPKRFLLAVTERLASACAHRVIAVSPSLADRYISLKLAPARKVCVLGAGSSKGVEYQRFARLDPIVVTSLRQRLALPAGVPVVGFVGRFTRDKGIQDLVDAFDIVRRSIPECALLLVGDFEGGDPVSPEVVTRIQEHPGVVLAGRVQDTAPYYALMDVLAFPSYREGFPNVPLEAAAAGLPVVGFRATGTVDAVDDGSTGTLVEVGDVAGFAAVLTRYLTEEELRKTHGEAGQARAREQFQPEHIWKELLEVYDRLLTETGRPRINGAIPSGSSEA